MFCGRPQAGTASRYPPQTLIFGHAAARHPCSWESPLALLVILIVIYPYLSLALLLSHLPARCTFLPRAILRARLVAPPRLLLRRPEQSIVHQQTTTFAARECGKTSSLHRTHELATWSRLVPYNPITVRPKEFLIGHRKRSPILLEGHRTATVERIISSARLLFSRVRAQRDTPDASAGSRGVSA